MVPTAITKKSDKKKEESDDWVDDVRGLEQIPEEKSIRMKKFLRGQSGKTC